MIRGMGKSVSERVRDELRSREVCVCGGRRASHRKWQGRCGHCGDCREFRRDGADAAAPWRRAVARQVARTPREVSPSVGAALLRVIERLAPGGEGLSEAERTLVAAARGALAGAGHGLAEAAASAVGVGGGGDSAAVDRGLDEGAV